MKLLFYNILFISISLLGCRGNLLGISSSSCRQFTYNSEKNAWVNKSNQVVQCSIADNHRIFDYIPGSGCEIWQEQFSGHDDTVQFVEMVIHTNKVDNFIGRKYCVLQRYVEHDKSGQALIINNGAYCAVGDPALKTGYLLADCDSINNNNTERETSSSRNSTRD